MSPRNQAGGLALWEAIVALVIVALLLAVISHKVKYAFANGYETRVFSNMRQLWLATEQMAIDGQTRPDSNLGWPGDTGGTFSNWAAPLLEGQYLSTNDFRKLLSGPHHEVRSLPPTNTAVLAYAVKSNSPQNTIFLTTVNFTNTSAGGAFGPSIKLFSTKGRFAVLNRGGEGEIRQFHRTNAPSGYAPLLR